MYRLPTDISIITTYRCPMRCVMCNIWRNPTRVDEEIRPEELEMLPDFKFVNITGGEPFVREDLDEIIDVMFRKSPRIVISTSGWFDDRVIALAEKYPKIGIRISIEGMRDKNDELRGRSGGFDKGVGILRELKRMGLKDIGFGITVSNHNSADMLELYGLSKELGMEFATAAFHNSFYFHKYDNVITNAAEVTDNFCRLIDAQLKENNPKSWFRAYFNMGLVNYVNGGKRLLPCEAGSVNCFLDPWGEIYPCNGMEEGKWKLSMGNIRSGKSFEEIWNSPEAEEVRRHVANCPKNCWMVGTVSPVMKKNIIKPASWVLANKARSVLGMKPKLSYEVRKTIEPLKIVVTGTRGIPSIQGGVETHCEELFPRIVSMGGDVVLLRRASYVEKGSANDVRAFKGVGLIDLPTPRRKSFEAIIHTFRAVVEAKRQKADIVHIHAVGPALLVPVAKMLGLKVVMTNHGPDYDREKWGKAAKAMLRLGERFGAKYADAVIVISEHIRRRLAERYGRTDADLIFNGVPVPEKDAGTDYTDSLGLQPGRYVVAIGRFVKEKNFHLLIEAFSRVAPEGIRLVIAGDADMPDDYSESLKRQAKDAGVVLTGFIKGRKLRQLMSHARLFVLPSTHEGLPISLLEAMSYGLDVLVSDIDANTLPQLDGADFFRVGDIDDLCASLSWKLSCESSGRVYDLSDYDWDIIAGKTMDVYRRVCGE